MYNSDTELIFPSRIIKDLRDLRGDAWRELIDAILADENPVSVERMSFILMMAELNSCNTCNSDSFRAMRGCTQCAIQNIRRHRGSDKEFINLYDNAKKKIEKNIKSLKEEN